MLTGRHIIVLTLFAAGITAVSSITTAAEPADFERLRHENAELVDIIRAQSLLKRYLEETTTRTPQPSSSPETPRTPGAPGTPRTPGALLTDLPAVHLPLMVCERSALRAYCHELGATFGNPWPEPHQ